MASKDLFVIDPPAADAPGKYLLIIQRSGATPFGGGSAAVVLVDGIIVVSPEIQGYLNPDRKVIVSFSKDTPYLMIDRALARVTNDIEIAKEDYASHKAMKEFMKTIDPEDQMSSGPSQPPETGLLVPGQYL